MKTLDLNDIYQPKTRPNPFAINPNHLHDWLHQNTETLRVEFNFEADIARHHPNTLALIHESIAREIAAEILKHKMVEFRKVKGEGFNQSRLTASLWIVKPDAKLTGE